MTGVAIYPAPGRPGLAWRFDNLDPADVVTEKPAPHVSAMLESARRNGMLTLTLIREQAEERGETLTRATVYRRTQNMLARHAQEAQAADMHADADALDMAARYMGARAARCASGGAA